MPKLKKQRMCPGVVTKLSNAVWETVTIFRFQHPQTWLCVTLAPPCFPICWDGSKSSSFWAEILTRPTIFNGRAEIDGNPLYAQRRYPLARVFLKNPAAQHLVTLSDGPIFEAFACSDRPKHPKQTSTHLFSVSTASVHQVYLLFHTKRYHILCCIGDPRT